MTQAGRPHISAVVGVCDEVELIGRSLDHLERQHVDSIVVVDGLSCDGTRELLHQWEAQGRILLLDHDNDPNQNAECLAAGVERARRDLGADWVLVQDADEFCLHPSGDLHEAVQSTDAAVVAVDRYNACLSDQLLDIFANPRGDIAAADIWVAPLRLTRDMMDRHPDIAWSTAQPVPKVLARTDSISGVAPGGHAVIGAHGTPCAATSDPALLTVHVPFLSFGRFRHKIERVKDLIAADHTYFKGAVGWHWRRWVEILDDGALEVEYQKQLVTPSILADLKSQSVVARAGDHLLERASIESAYG